VPNVQAGLAAGKIVWRGRGSKQVKDNRERNQQMRKTSASTESAVREVSKPDEQWRAELSPLQYSVLRHAHTERPFTGEYVHNPEDGSYRCAGCGSVLFSSNAKFDSGTGWPSFDEPAVAEAVELRPDNSLFMRRTEVVCRRCGGHLGHVFDDGPTETGDRYCINSCSLAFEPATSDK
jgi:peptide-methionine (R)-S-oxide reductase